MDPQIQCCHTQSKFLLSQRGFELSMLVTVTLIVTELCHFCRWYLHCSFNVLVFRNIIFSWELPGNARKCNLVWWKSFYKWKNSSLSHNSCNLTYNMEIPANSRCSTLLPGSVSVSVQLEWPPGRTAVRPLVGQNTDHQKDHLVCQPLWNSWWVDAWT